MYCACRVITRAINYTTLVSPVLPEKVRGNPSLLLSYRKIWSMIVSYQVKYHENDRVKFRNSC